MFIRYTYARLSSILFYLKCIFQSSLNIHHSATYRPVGTVLKKVTNMTLVIPYRGVNISWMPWYVHPPTQVLRYTPCSRLGKPVVVGSTVPVGVGVGPLAVVVVVAGGILVVDVEAEVVVIAAVVPLVVD